MICETQQRTRSCPHIAQSRSLVAYHSLILVPSFHPEVVQGISSRGSACGAANTSSNLLHHGNFLRLVFIYRPDRRSTLWHYSLKVWRYLGLKIGPIEPSPARRHAWWSGQMLKDISQLFQNSSKRLDKSAYARRAAQPDELSRSHTSAPYWWRRSLDHSLRSRVTVAFTQLRHSSPHPMMPNQDS